MTDFTKRNQRAATRIHRCSRKVTAKREAYFSVITANHLAKRHAIADAVRGFVRIDGHVEVHLQHASVWCAFDRGVDECRFGRLAFHILLLQASWGATTALALRLCWHLTLAFRRNTETPNRSKQNRRCTQAQREWGHESNKSRTIGTTGGAVRLI